MKRHIEILLIAIICFSFTQINEEQPIVNLEQARAKALADNIIGKEYQYSFVERKDCNNTRIKYLGVVTTSKTEKFKLLNSFLVFGQSCRGVSRIVIYDMNNIYIGNYYVGMPYNLPDTLVNNNLIYLKNHECKAKKGTKISFEQGLPKDIFIPCDNLDSGDLVSYSVGE